MFGVMTGMNCTMRCDLLARKMYWLNLVLGTNCKNLAKILFRMFAKISIFHQKKEGVIIIHMRSIFQVFLTVCQNCFGHISQDSRWSMCVVDQFSLVASKWFCYTFIRLKLTCGLTIYFCKRLSLSQSTEVLSIPRSVQKHQTQIPTWEQNSKRLVWF